MHVHVQRSHERRPVVSASRDRVARGNRNVQGDRDILRAARRRNCRDRHCHSARLSLEGEPQVLHPEREPQHLRRRHAVGPQGNRVSVVLHRQRQRCHADVRHVVVAAQRSPVADNVLQRGLRYRWFVFREVEAEHRPVRLFDGISRHEAIPHFQDLDRGSSHRSIISDRQCIRQIVRIRKLRHNRRTNLSDFVLQEARHKRHTRSHARRVVRERHRDVSSHGK